MQFTGAVVSDDAGEDFGVLIEVELATLQVEVVAQLEDVDEFLVSQFAQSRVRVSFQSAPQHFVSQAADVQKHTTGASALRELGLADDPVRLAWHAVLADQLFALRGSSLKLSHWPCAKREVAVVHRAEPQPFPRLAEAFAFRSESASLQELERRISGRRNGRPYANGFTFVTPLSTWT